MKKDNLLTKKNVWKTVISKSLFLLVVILIINSYATVAPAQNKENRGANRSVTAMSQSIDDIQLKEFSNEEFEKFIENRKPGYKTYFTEPPGTSLAKDTPKDIDQPSNIKKNEDNDSSDSWMIMLGASEILLTGLLGPGIAFVIVGKGALAVVSGIVSLIP